MTGSELRHSPALGRPLRGGALESLGTPSEDELLRAYAAGDRAAARRWLEYAAGEKRRCLAAYVQWLEALLTIAHERHPAFDAELARLTDAIGCPPPLDPERAARDDALRRVEAALSTQGGPNAVASAVEHWVDAERDTHDRQADWCWGILSSLQAALGEPSMEGVLRESLEGWVTERYSALESLSHRERLELTLEAMRAEFGGPRARGDIEVVEEEDRWVLRFDPCGTGGRMLRGDPTPRTEPPYEFATVEGAYDWTWGESGVCLYCAHCSFVNEILPIERIGAPLRVTSPPIAASDPCQWVLYKSDAAVPDEAFSRVGKRRPQR